MTHIAVKSLAPIPDALKVLSLLKSVMVICCWKTSKSMRSYHLKLHISIQKQGTLTVHKSIGLKHPLTIVSRCIFVAEETSSTALMVGLDLESLCNPFFKSISYKQLV